MLQQQGISIQAFTSKVGHIQLEKSYEQLNLDQTENNIVRCPDEETANKMIDYIDEVRKNKDSVGGVISCVIKNCACRTWRSGF